MSGLLLSIDTPVGDFVSVIREDGHAEPFRVISNPGGTIIGPGVSVVGDVAIWDDTTGTLVADSGVAIGDVVTNPGTSTSGNLPEFADASGTLLTDSGVAVDDVVTNPGAAVSGNLARFDDTTGNLIGDAGESVASLGRLEIVTEAGATRTLTSADAGAYIRCTNAGGCVITVNSGVFTAGDSVLFRQVGAGAISFAGTATLTPPVTNTAVSGQQGATVGLVMHTNALGDVSGDLQDA